MHNIYLCIIGNHSVIERLKCYIVTARHGITRKKSTRSRKRLKYRGNMF